MKLRTNDNGIQYLVSLVIIYCLLLAILLPGCSQAPYLPQPAPTPPASTQAPDTRPTEPAPTPPTDSAPAQPISARIRLSDAPVLGREIEVVATFTLSESYKRAENVTAQLILTDAFELVESKLKSYEELREYARIPKQYYEKYGPIQSELAKGSVLTKDPETGDALLSKRCTIVEWNGDMAGGETIEVKATVKAARITPTVNWDEIRAIAWSSVAGGGETDYVRIYDDHGEVSDVGSVLPQEIINPSDIDNIAQEKEAVWAVIEQ